MKQPLVFVLDDEHDMRELMCEMLDVAETTCESFGTLEEFARRVDETLPDVVVTDFHLGGHSADEVSALMMRRAPDVPVIWVTGRESLRTAITAVRSGAFDFLVKPFEEFALVSSVERAAETSRLRREVKELRAASSTNERSSGVYVGNSVAMQSVHDLVSRIAEVDVTVLITGESGVGKEVIARSIHDQSGVEGPFVAVNCASIPEQLLESELFGHVKGAFTGAKRDRDGLFVRAEGGTLFLDEVGELPIEMQSKLLRALQERKVRPVGSDRERSFDTRVLSATNRDLEDEIEEGGFREDLYYRLNVVRIDVPPLRARRNDVLGLAHFFLRRTAERLGREVTGFSVEASEHLLGYDWPGNVRELSNAMERAVALARFSEIVPDDLPPKIVDSGAAADTALDGLTPDGLPTLREVEDRYIQRVLNVAEDNKAEAARILGIDRKTLYRRLSQISETD